MDEQTNDELAGDDMESAATTADFVSTLNVDSEMEDNNDFADSDYEPDTIADDSEDGYQFEDDLFEDEVINSSNKRVKIDSDSQDSDEKSIIPYENEEFLDDDIDQFIEAPDTCFVPKKGKSKKLISAKERKQERTNYSSLVHDDGDRRLFEKRIEQYRIRCEELNAPFDADDYELHQVVDEFRIPKQIWNRLFTHQQDCLQWLWNNHRNLSGSLIGDEMGLGKTIQVIAFFIALRFSHYAQIGQTYSSLGPVLLVCPSTLMHHWVSEFHKWWPHFRVALLHHSSSFKNKKRELLIREIFRTKSILITSYNGLCAYHKQLVTLDWHYIVLDEGHKIRNPDTLVTHCCKLFKTAHRLVLTGTPIQNNLKELWSIFDFIYPGKLGTLDSFMANIAHPIRVGGYATAKDFQVRVAYKCTVILRELIKPYLLRRTKDEVESKLALPPKSEQVLFCKLTEKQRELYEEYIKSDVIKEAFSRKMKLFGVLINLRKICNHPFLFYRQRQSEEYSMNSEFIKESGKMIVLKSILKLWFREQHRVLLFTQSRQMLDLIERFVCKRDYKYVRMDGQTAIKSRQMKIDQFNHDSSIFLFLLTTKVGGIGINLTGADRVIIFDPDWNPSTDIQARERCWRIGQKNNVIIYRFLTVGTVEEKIYHRQIFKQYLTKRVLENPCHRRFFKFNHLQELFTLREMNETSEIFSESKVKLKSKESKQQPKESMIGKYSKQTSTKAMLASSDLKLPKIAKLPNVSRVVDASQLEVKLSEEKIQELRERAKLLSQRFSETYAAKSASTSGTDKENKEEIEPGTSKLKPKKSGIKFEGKRCIDHLLRAEMFEEKESSKKRKKKKDEDYILSSLLGSSLQTVLQHDKIEQSSNDFSLMERQAEEMAANALKSLYQDSVDRKAAASKKQLFGALSSAGSADNGGINGAKLSSSELVKLIKQGNNQGKYPMSSASFTSSTAKINTNSRFDEIIILLKSIREFVMSVPGTPKQMSTEQIVARFVHVRPDQAAIFRSLLRNLCDFNKQTSLWTLREEFLDI